MISPRLLSTASVLFLLLAGAGITANYVVTIPDEDLKVDELADIWTGKVASRLEEGYERELPFSNFAVEFFNAVSLGVFGEARKGAIVGRSGWLFTAEEFAWSRTSEANLATSFQTIVDVRSRLAEKGTTLVIVPIPPKAQVVAGQLGSNVLPETNADLYERFMAFLNKKGIAAADVAATFGSAKPEELFLRSDTHWTVKGSGLAAKAACAAIPRRDQLMKTAFDSVSQNDVNHVGDLAKFVDAGWMLPGAGTGFDIIQPISAAARADNADALFGDGEAGAAPADQVVLVGTSYSANPLWSFEDQLKTTCEVDVLNYAREGKGPFVPMQDFLEKLRSQAAPKVVLWEIPVRYLDDIV
ncbi:MULTISPECIES: hypothetical protein [Agrobacterium]|uniref:AlgX/AlgJ SGNH hydrolase-like domain-containing protein n=1 Tax=Agrobacterium tumefaciens TaxID=358 RepID=A0AAE6BII0_AGRTU|nr:MULTISPECIES: hypothetical protein [Agrobacterium]QCL76663.1 hypothetical protein CFBP5499_25110 [Agrobacterium tumefaciens]QCL82182.1 hypothetical protein CFBP5877_24360 [Agrobacterium tumefaciens]CUX65469.1 putative Alginate biosynthesis protein AlgJ [Agrobacterium sp. NCPPB 925]